MWDTCANITKYPIYICDMPKELLLYTPFYASTAMDLITKMEEIKSGDITIRVNSPGGSVSMAYGVFAKMREKSKAGQKIHIKVDGIAASGAGNMLLFADSAEALSVSDFILHRAAADYEGDMTQEQKDYLLKVNTDLRNLLESKVSNDKFKEVTGHSVDEMFALDKRIDIRLNSKQAKDLGLIQKIVKLETSQDLAAYYGSNIELMAQKLDDNKKEAKPVNTAQKHMTKEELKSQHPSVYDAIVAEATDIASKRERDRVASLTAYIGVDEAFVKAKINDGTFLSEAERSDLSIKLVNAQFKGQEKKEIEAVIEKTPEPIVVAKVADSKVEASAEDNELEAEYKKIFNVK